VSVADDLTQLLSATTDVNWEQAEAAIDIVTALVKSYTRGGGFAAGSPNEDIHAVILTASARLLAHPRQISMGETMGPMGVNFGAGFTGWTVTETFVLNRYRKRAE
jgi:hypothetical protein